ncbi:MAG: hypothetical protein IPP37_09215 [Saprospiraceae bacterium]|nr:hypothetical protein [Saprospiraceae bacterium]
MWFFILFAVIHVYLYFTMTTKDAVRSAWRLEIYRRRLFEKQATHLNPEK